MRYRKGLLYISFLIIAFSINPIISFFCLDDEKEFIDINSASFEELTLIPGIGETIAKRIVEYREMKGKIESIDELIEIKGIGPKRLMSIKRYARCD